MKTLRLKEGAAMLIFLLLSCCVTRHDSNKDINV